MANVNDKEDSKTSPRKLTLSGSVLGVNKNQLMEKFSKSIPNTQQTSASSAVSSGRDMQESIFVKNTNANILNTDLQNINIDNLLKTTPSPAPKPKVAPVEKPVEIKESEVIVSQTFNIASNAKIDDEEEDDSEDAKLSLAEKGRRKIESVQQLVKYDKFQEFDEEDLIKKAQEGIALQQQLNEYEQLLDDEDANKFAEILSQSDEKTRSKRRPNRFKAEIKTEKRQARQKQEEIARLVKEVKIGATIGVSDLAKEMSIKVSEVIKALFDLGIMATPNQSVDGDTAELIVTELGHIPVRVESDSIKEILYGVTGLEKADIRSIAPVVTVMGHVDHGKTSLLDALRQTDVVSGEAGGITQHIGAYRVTLENGKSITFIDTPGHAAFTAIRARGAKVTDIVVLVVAADDSIMPQTIEAINHAQAAGVPIVVAINKIDKPGADIQRVKNDLLQHNVVCEDFGGQVIAVPISAKQKLNLDKLEEAILLQAEILDLKANFASKPTGVVLEAKIDKNKGIVATVLVQKGTLRTREIIIAGEAMGRVRMLVNEKGESLDSVYPSQPVEIYGFDSIPQAGDKFYIVDNEKVARTITEKRRNQRIQSENIVTPSKDVNSLFKTLVQEKKEINLIIKADVQSSIEAIRASIEKLKQDEVKIKILHSGAGNIGETDILLAKTYKAFVIAFNVKLDSKILSFADKEHVPIKTYNIIYELIDEVESMIKGMIAPVTFEKDIGEVEIRNIFNITGQGKIAGCMVLKGTAINKSNVRLVRDGKVIYTSKIKALKRFKENVKEVHQGFECGVQLDNFEDFQANDRLQLFEIVEQV